MYILSGDIGGTNTRLKISRLIDGKITPIIIKKYKGVKYHCLADIIKIFMNEVDFKNKISACCIAVAGPVKNGEVELTNLPWVVSEQVIGDTLGIDCKHVKLINDFESIGYGVDVLDPKDLYTLQEGKYEKDSLRAIIGAGTGLGMSIVSYKNNTTSVFKTEGGHVDFSPVNDEQIELFKYLKKSLHRVSPERVCSGIGIVNIYKYVIEKPLYNQTENTDLKRCLFKLSNSNKPAKIVEYAKKHSDPSCLRTIDIFLRIYGAVAGNLALTTLPYRGVYIVGGIAPRLLKEIELSGFMDLFRDKGRMSALMMDIPVHVVLDTDVGLKGAAVVATLML